MTKVIELVEMQWKAADFKGFFPQRGAVKRLQIISGVPAGTPFPMPSPTRR
jgi:hypothetical protein